LVAANGVYAGPFSSIGKLGDLLMVIPPAYAWGMTVAEADWDGSIRLAKTMISTQLAVEGIKMLEIERRPDGGDWKSFPSGHSAGAFTGAMFVHKRYGWKPAIVPYIISGVVGWSRVKVKAHYWHDVLAGAAISALFVWVFADKYEGFRVSVGPGEAKIGFSASF
jgi:membrane-associated phospholipid phosphatase